MDVDYSVLGPLEVRREGQPVQLGGRKQRALLVLLLLSNGEQRSADRLIEDLWAGAPPRQALSTLRGYISNLRRLLSEGNPGADPILTRSSGYVLELADDDMLDIAHLEQLAGRARQMLEAGALEESESVLEEARSLWRGSPLADVADEPFAQAEIARLTELRLLMDEQRLEVRLRAGRHAEAVGDLERLVSQQPHREARRGKLMLALYRSGRQTEALRVYTDCRSALIEDLGVEPGPALQALQERILLQDPDLDWRPSTSAAVFEAGPPPATAAGVPPARPPLIGRDEELARLDAALLVTGSGGSRYVLIGGEPGIGKTRLLEETADRGAERGALTVWGHCLDGLGAPAFWPWVEVLRELVATTGTEQLRALAAGTGDLALLVPELGGGPVEGDAETARFRLYDAVARLLRAVAERRRLVVLLEDLHWADPASLDLLRFLAAGTAVPGLLLVASYRDTEVTGGHPLQQVLAALARSTSIERLRPPGMSTGDVERYIRDLTGAEPTPEVAQAVREMTSGNPFFVAEIVRLLGGAETAEDVQGGDIPINVQDVLRRRLDQLPAEVVETLLQASYGPDGFLVATIATLLGRDVDEVLDHCQLAVDARLLEEFEFLGGHGYRFAHALVRELLYRSIPSLRRAEGHGRIGDLLAGQLDSQHPDRVASGVAWHYVKAAATGRAEEAVRWSREAARRSSAALGFESAADHLRRAMDVAAAHSPGDLPTRADLARELAVALRNAGDLDGTMAALREAVALARRMGDATRIAKAAFRSGGGGMWGIWSAQEQANEEVIGWLEEALDGLPPDSPWRATMASRLAAELFFTDEVEQRKTLAAEGVELARASGSSEVLITAYAFRRLATWSQENTAWRLANADEMVELSPAVRPFSAAICHHVRMVDRLESGLLEESDADLRAVEAIAERAGQHGLQVQLAWNRAVRSFHEGRFDEAEERATAARELERRSDPSSADALFDCLLTLVRAEQGRLSELLATLSRRSASSHAASYLWKVLLLRAHAEADRVTEAQALLEDVAAGSFGSMPRGILRPTYLAQLADVCRALGDAPRAKVLLALVEGWSSKILVTAGGHQAHGALDLHRGLLAEAIGDLGGALALHRSGLALNRAVDARPFVARSCLAVARCLRQRDTGADAPAVAGLLRESLELAEDMGMAAVAADARRALDETVPV